MEAILSWNNGEHEPPNVDPDHQYSIQRLICQITNKFDRSIVIKSWVVKFHPKCWKTYAKIDVVIHSENVRRYHIVPSTAESKKASHFFRHTKSETTIVLPELGRWQSFYSKTSRRHCRSSKRAFSYVKSFISLSGKHLYFTSNDEIIRQKNRLAEPLKGNKVNRVLEASYPCFALFINKCWKKIGGTLPR